MTSQSKQVSAPTRPCLACEGAGYDPTVADGCSAPYVHDTYCICHESPCPVCLGSGQVEAKMPARDAVADAETLRVFVLLPESFVDDEILHHVHEAAFDGLGSQYAPSATMAWRYAFTAARAAFRAVPGLRGE